MFKNTSFYGKCIKSLQVLIRLQQLGPLPPDPGLLPHLLIQVTKCTFLALTLTIFIKTTDNVLILHRFFFIGGDGRM